MTPETAELIRRVRRLALRARRVARTGLAGAWRRVHRGRGMAFEEVRPYTPGDDVRFIDCNVTARAGDPHGVVRAICFAWLAQLCRAKGTDLALT